MERVALLLHLIHRVLILEFSLAIVTVVAPLVMVSGADVAPA